MTDSLIARLRASCLAGACLLALAACPVAWAADVVGGRDPDGVTRFPGSRLIGHYAADWSAVDFPLSAEIDTSTHRFRKALTVEGKVTRVYYLAPVGKSALEVFRNYQQAFARAGLKTQFSCDGDCGNVFFRWRFGPARTETHWADGSLQAADGKSGGWSLEDALAAEQGRGFYGTLTQGGRTVHVSLYTSVAGYAPVGAAGTVIEIAEPRAMEADQVKVDAAAMGRGLADQGKVVLGGIYFDTGKAVLKPASDAQLQEMAQLLKSQPALEVFIVGHTDNQGGFEGNLTLSRQRAEAVRDALVQRFKTDGRRITPYGVANVSPMAPNAAEPGRAQNRRVELVAR